MANLRDFVVLFWLAAFLSLAVFFDHSFNVPMRIEPGKIPTVPHSSRIPLKEGVQTLPHAIIIGGRKCGTRALLEFLSLHPRIQIARHEIHFFDNHTNFKKGLEWYRSKMPFLAANKSHNMVVEKTPSYLVKHYVPKRIFLLNRKVKIILILRDPVVRAISDFTQAYSSKNVTGSDFDNHALTLVGRGRLTINSGFKPIRNSLYGMHLSHWMKYFSPNQILILDGERFIHHPLSQLRQVETFLHLPHSIKRTQLYFNRTKGFYCYFADSGTKKRVKRKCLGNDKGRKHVNVSIDTVRRLYDFYEPYNRKFFELINRTFTWNHSDKNKC